RITKRNLVDYNNLLIKISEYIKTLIINANIDITNQKLENLKNELWNRRKIYIDIFTHGIFENSYLAFAKLKILYNAKFVKRINYRKTEYFKRIHL
ncbi:MAG: hypothetical protein QXO21_01390, partial [Candidatus Anstonellales archaeon]